MNLRTLHSYWVEHDTPHGPIGYGVTAVSEADAFELLDSSGCELYSSDKYREIKSLDEIPSQIARNALGSMVVRGIWYPFAEPADVA